MFERNVLTFNPGWDYQAQPVGDQFTDVREHQLVLVFIGAYATFG